MRSVTAGVLALVCTLMLYGCAHGPKMPPTPNLYVQGEDAALTEMPADRQTVDIKLIYATDRKPIESDNKKQEYYDERRSDSLAVGIATVRLGEDLEWDQVLSDSLDPKANRFPLELTAAEELIRYPSSTTIPIWVDDKLVDSPEFLEAREAADQAVRDEISKKLATSERKEVFVYIHGVGNAFDDPMFRMAELWHYLGRPGVPVVYSWPAIKGGGPLRGYTYARESSEFTVYHLRQFLQAVASCPDVERIHILAHSRGTGVALSVLRDLRLIYKDDAAGARETLKIGNVIFAAPDIDLQVAQQRYRPDQMHEIIDRMTMYMTPEDKALGISSFLFSSLTRVGTTTAADLSPEQIQGMKDGRMGIDAINVNVSKKGAHGHTYWIDNPAVLSDIILILRDDRSPGKENGRPLLRPEAGLFWEVNDGYPFADDHAVEDE